MKIWHLLKTGHVSLEDVVAFVTADADSDFSSDVSEEEEESSEEEIEVDNEEHSTNPKRCRAKGGLCRRIRTRDDQNRVNNFRRDNLENRWKTEDKDPIIPAFSGEIGIKIDFPYSCNELDIFKCFITDELIDYITKETNKYATLYIAANSAMVAWLSEHSPPGNGTHYLFSMVSSKLYNC